MESESSRKKLFYIDATMREESRTRRIALPLMEELGKTYDIETVRLDGAQYPAVGSRILRDRDNGIVPEEYASMARRLASADRIVIAAPFHREHVSLQHYIRKQ